MIEREPLTQQRQGDGREWRSERRRRDAVCLSEIDTDSSSRIQRGTIQNLHGGGNVVARGM